MYIIYEGIGTVPGSFLSGTNYAAYAASTCGAYTGYACSAATLLLCTSTVNAATSVPQTLYPSLSPTAAAALPVYTLLSSPKLVASSWSSLMSGSTPITWTGFASDRTWTGCNANGVYSGVDCTDWTTASPGTQGTSGSPITANAQISFTTNTCNLNRYHACVAACSLQPTPAPTNLPSKSPTSPTTRSPSKSPSRSPSRSPTSSPGNNAYLIWQGSYQTYTGSFLSGTTLSAFTGVACPANLCPFSYPGACTNTVPLLCSSTYDAATNVPQTLFPSLPGSAPTFPVYTAGNWSSGSKMEVLVAPSWSSLMVSSPIAWGGMSANAQTWTGCTANGVYSSGLSCTDWTVTTGNGNSGTATISNTQMFSTTSACTTSKYVYCVSAFAHQQPAPNSILIMPGLFSSGSWLSGTNVNQSGVVTCKSASTVTCLTDPIPVYCTATVSASTLIPSYLGLPTAAPVVGPTTAPVASSWTNFLAGTAAPLTSAGVTAGQYWTGCTSSGTTSGSTCNNWIAATPTTHGTYGDPSSAGTALSSNTATCNTFKNLYCACGIYATPGPSASPTSAKPSASPTTTKPSASPTSTSPSRSPTSSPAFKAYVLFNSNSMVTFGWVPNTCASNFDPCYPTAAPTYCTCPTGLSCQSMTVLACMPLKTPGANSPNASDHVPRSLYGGSLLSYSYPVYVASPTVPATQIASSWDAFMNNNQLSPSMAPALQPGPYWTGCSNTGGSTSTQPPAVPAITRYQWDYTCDLFRNTPVYGGGTFAPTTAAINGLNLMATNLGYANDSTQRFASATNTSCMGLPGATMAYLYCVAATTIGQGITAAPQPPTTAVPSWSPTISPTTASPSRSPTNKPSKSPSRSPTTKSPSRSPSRFPTRSPTASPYLQFGYYVFSPTITPTSGAILVPTPTPVTTFASTYCQIAFSTALCPASLVCPIKTTSAILCTSSFSASTGIPQTLFPGISLASASNLPVLAGNTTTFIPIAPSWTAFLNGGATSDMVGPLGATRQSYMTGCSATGTFIDTSHNCVDFTQTSNGYTVGATSNKTGFVNTGGNVGLCTGSLPIMCVTAYTTEPGYTGAPVCFPSAATAETTAGPRRMDALSVGDVVLAADPSGVLSYSPILFFFKQDPADRAQYLLVTGRSGRALSLSPDHLIFADDPPRELPARELAVGQTIWVKCKPRRLCADVIVALRLRAAEGAYTPVTALGTLIVDGVLAASFCENPFTHSAATLALYSRFLDYTGLARLNLFSPLRVLQDYIRLAQSTLFRSAQSASPAANQSAPGAPNEPMSSPDQPPQSTPSKPVHHDCPAPAG